MSRQSRKRLLNRLQGVDHRAMSPRGSMFVTLTYATLPGPGQAKRHLNAFLSWVDRHYDKPVVVWSQELGETFGRLHFHLIIYASRGESLYTLKNRMTRAWERNTKGCGGFIKAADTVSPERVGAYLAKYIAKGSDKGSAALAGAGMRDSGARTGAAGAENVPDLTKAHIFTKWEWEGRSWGIRNQEKMTFADTVELAIAITAATLPDIRRVDSLLVSFLRIVRGWVRSNHRKGVEELAERMKCMRRDKQLKSVCQTKRSGDLYCWHMNRDLDWSLPVAWAKMGKARVGFLNPRGDWRAFTLYVPPTFDFFAVMEWIGGNLTRVESCDL